MKSLRIILFFSMVSGFAQQKGKAVYFKKAAYMKEVSALSKIKSLIPPNDKIKEVNPKRVGSNQVVPGKGYPKNGDPLASNKINNTVSKIKGKGPVLSFEAASSGSTPTDPTGAVGPNHYINAWNSSFAIYDKLGNILMPAASLANLWAGETLGDPIVFYDSFADRFVITEFSQNPNGFLVAVCKGSDPVNDGWYTYRFNTDNSFPDYPKFSIWSDGYYITANKDQNTASTSQVVYALERDKMIIGDNSAQIIGFPLPGIKTSGFYSPSGFNALGTTLPPVGNAPIIYMQDDSWANVSEDALKIWEINVDWTTPSNSIIEESQELTVSNGDITAFDSVFDGGSFSNLPQPSGADVDALQATVMYMTNYRRFVTHNSVVLNFVIDLDGNDDNAGIRWYELRQTVDGQPWTVYQEGTYVQPNGDSAYSGSICIDVFGNISLAYTVVSLNTYPSLRYTGRYESDPLGQMTINEEVIVDGVQSDPSSRYGDYSQTTIDPVNNTSFWHIGEYFKDNTRKNQVGVFNIATNDFIDVGVTSIVSPVSGSLSNTEQVVIAVRNFGTEDQINIPVSFQVNGGNEITGIVPSISAQSLEQYTFANTIDLSSVGTTYTLTSSTDLSTDIFTVNNETSSNVKNLPANDIGVSSIETPENGVLLGSETVTITIKNYGGSPQSNFNISYNLSGGVSVIENFIGPLNVGESISYSFSTLADLSITGVYEICSTTMLIDDFDTLNNKTCRLATNLNCIPETTGSCNIDGVKNFKLGTIDNSSGCGEDNGAIGYSDFTAISTELDRSINDGIYTVSITSGYTDEVASIWIDFNDNAVFEIDEQLLSNGLLPVPNVSTDFQITIPNIAALGSHLLRVKAIDEYGIGTGVDDPCGDVEWGETEDYIVTIKDQVLNIKDMLLEDAELKVISEGDDQYMISLSTSFTESLKITVHNMIGQKLIENKMESIDGKYTYPLDMSYASSGFYLIRVGTRNYGVVNRVVVKLFIVYIKIFITLLILF